MDDFGFGSVPTVDPLGEVDSLTGLRKAPKPLQPQIDEYNKDALVKSLRNTKDWAKGQFSLDEQPNRGPVATAADMGLGFVPGIGQAAAVRDIERARRADDSTGMALAGAGIVPWGKAVTAGRELIAGQKALKAPLENLKVAKGAEQLGEDSWNTASWFRGHEDTKPWKWEVSDQNATLKNVPPTVDSKLSDVLHHPELYENYPHLADMKVTGSIGPHNPHVEGGFYPSDNSIDLHAPDAASFRKGLLHEVQHSIQNVEPGFESGTSPDRIRELLQETRAEVGTAPHTSDKAFADQQYWRNRGESEARVVEARADFTPEQASRMSPAKMGVPPELMVGRRETAENITKRARQAIAEKLRAN